MKKIITELLRSLFLLFLVLSSVQPALAHGDEPRLDISVERINPGGVVDIRGVGFELEELVNLTLVGNGAEFPLGEITADEEGIFLYTVTLPVELTEGTYYFQATTDDHNVMSSALTVFGAALSAEGAEPLRDEDDGLVAPMPTYAPGVAPTTVPQSVAETVSEEQPDSRLTLSMLALAILSALIVFLAFRFRVIGRVKT